MVITAIYYIVITLYVFNEKTKQINNGKNCDCGT